MGFWVVAAIVTFSLNIWHFGMALMLREVPDHRSGVLLLNDTQLSTLYDTKGIVTTSAVYQKQGFMKSYSINQIPSIHYIHIPYVLMLHPVLSNPN